MQTFDPYRRRRILRRFIIYGGLPVSLFATAFVAILLFVPGASFDAFLQKKILTALHTASPEYDVRIAGLHYSFLDNRFDCDSVSILKTDSSLSCNISMLSISGIDRWELLWSGGIAPDQLTSSHADAKDIVLTFPHSQYELRCARLHLSTPDSALVAEILEFHPPMNDAEYFAASRFRRTRYHLVIPECSVTGLACSQLLEGTSYRARAANITDASLSILINKEKPASVEVPDLSTPRALFSEIQESLEIDSIRIINGRLMYSERFDKGAVPAILTCDSMQILAEGLKTLAVPGDTALIAAKGIISDGGTLNLGISMPLGGEHQDFRYWGNLSRMNASLLNPFIEVSEVKRLKTGVIHSIAFDIDVSSATAVGTVRAAYKDLKIVAIEKGTGSEAGIGNTILSFFANNIKLRTSNIPDASGAMKIGKVNYTRKPNETFFEFTWLALRGGLCDVIGF